MSCKWDGEKSNDFCMWEKWKWKIFSKRRIKICVDEEEIGKEKEEKEGMGESGH